MKHATWKWFVIRRFLLILLLLTLSEKMLNFLYDGVIYPWIGEVLHFRFFMMDLENGQTVGLLIRGGAYLAAMGICGLLPDPLRTGLQSMAEQFAGERLTSWIVSQTGTMTGREARLYLLGTAVLTVFIIVTLVLPYVIAAFAFSRMVEQHIRELEVQERQQREEYDRRRNLLLSDVAHDLKTPMTAVAGYARALLEEQEETGGEKGLCLRNEEKQALPRKEYLETIYGKSMQMSGLLNLLFEYVKLDSEGYRLNRTEENLWELLRETIANLYMDFEEKKMEILPEIPEEEVRLKVDKVQFQRVVSNLLSNAVRHNPEGTRVWIKAEWEEEQATVRVCDDGPEIPPEMAAYIFDPFVLGDESRRSKGGSGLGLSIAWKIIDMHGGSLTLEQEEGEVYTKTFLIRLPCTRAETEKFHGLNL